MITLEEAIEKFHTSLPLEIQEEFGSPACTKALEEIGGRYGIDLSGLAVFVAVGELKFENLGTYIENEFDFETIKAQKLARELRESVFDPLVSRLNFFNAETTKSISIDQEKSFAEKIFHSGLLAELDGSPIIIDAINNRLFYILARDDSFKRRLEQALYENDELVTSAPITLNGQSVPPSVRNWLKDYIGRYGSQASDNVSQSSFLINSDNVRLLDDYERDRLALVLKVYINIKFFPNSMPSDTGEGWAILPGGTVEELVDEEEDQTDSPTESATSKSAPAPKPRATKAAVSVAPAAQPAAPARPPVAPAADSADIINLKNLLLQYPVGSLERKAIEEELKNMQK